MNEASQYLLSLAQSKIQAYLANSEAKAAMVTGSTATGQADFYSDVEMFIYYDDLPLYSVSVGDKNAERTIVAIAGMHASEVIGQLALVDLIDKLNSENTQRLQYHFVPVADPDLLAENVKQLSEPITLPKLLSLKAVRDLEGHFTSNHYPECEVIRQWLETFPHAKVNLPYQELDLSTQIELIHEFVLASGKYLLKQYQ